MESKINDQLFAEGGCVGQIISAVWFVFEVVPVWGANSALLGLKPRERWRSRHVAMANGAPGGSAFTSATAADEGVVGRSFFQLYPQTGQTSGQNGLLVWVLVDQINIHEVLLHVALVLIFQIF